MGDIANVAKFDVKEGPVRFVRYEPLATAEHVPQSQPDPPSLIDGMRHALWTPDRRLRASTVDPAAFGEVCWKGEFPVMRASNEGTNRPCPFLGRRGESSSRGHRPASVGEAASELPPLRFSMATPSSPATT